MKTSLLSVVAAGLLLTGSGIYAAETTTTTTTTWTSEYGDIIRQDSTTQHYKSIDEPNIEVRVGAELPQSVTTYDLPATVRIPERERYSYVIVKDHPVVVEKGSHRVIYTY